MYALIRGCVFFDTFTLNGTDRPQRLFVGHAINMESI